YTFTAAYGVHFDTTSSDTFLIFADASCTNGLYDTAHGACPTDEVAQRSNLDRGFRIVKVCAPAQADTATCLNATTPNVSPLDVLFKRPEPDALISALGQSCTLSNGSACYESARIVVQSPRGDVDSVVIENNGQISVQK